MILATQSAVTSTEHSRQIQAMFSSIAPRYDFLNMLLSGGRDRVWRKKVSEQLRIKKDERILDVATGTGDVALEMASSLAGRNARYFGVDFSPAMLGLAKKKSDNRQLGSRIQYQAGAAESLPYKSELFDGATVAFGVRNFSNVAAGLKEIHRVLKPGGRFVVLEFTLPRNPVLRWGYKVYFENLLPLIGRLISKHPEAYRYLPESVNRFAQRDYFIQLLNDAGFSQANFRDLTLGIVAVYSAIKEKS